ncbi:MAG: HD domain-containing phosphohydrolase [bacterium]
MKKTLLVDIHEGDIAAMDVYDCYGNELIKTGAILKKIIKNNLEKADISHIFIKDDETIVHSVYKQKILAELLKIIKCYITSNGKSSEILNRYNDKEIKRFLSGSNENSTKIAYGHILKYMAVEMSSCFNNKTKYVYDFSDYRSKETYLEYHIRNTACISGVIAQNMGLNSEDIKAVIIGAVLCDLTINQYKFIKERRKLTAIETEKLKQHSLLSYEIARNTYGIPAKSALISAQHHERYDGSGYPNGLKGHKIGLASKIVMLADVYDALISDRPHRKSYSTFEAWKYIEINSGILFDPVVVEEFKRSIPKYYPGDSMNLSDGKTGVILENFYGNKDNTTIKIIEK